MHVYYTMIDLSLLASELLSEDDLRQVTRCFFFGEMHLICYISQKRYQKNVKVIRQHDNQPSLPLPVLPDITELHSLLSLITPQVLDDNFASVSRSIAYSQITYTRSWIWNTVLQPTKNTSPRHLESYTYIQ